jgi:hypothetical protein
MLRKYMAMMIVAVISLFAVACGGSDDGGSSPADSQSEIENDVAKAVGGAESVGCTKHKGEKDTYTCYVETVYENKTYEVTKTDLGIRLDPG